MKKAVVFYSLSGNTQAAAKEIAEGIGADLIELKLVKRNHFRQKSQNN